jgi:hypothetical protein
MESKILLEKYEQAFSVPTYVIIGMVLIVLLAIVLLVLSTKLYWNPISAPLILLVTIGSLGIGAGYDGLHRMKAFYKHDLQEEVNKNEQSFEVSEYRCVKEESNGDFFYINEEDRNGVTLIISSKDSKETYSGNVIVKEKNIDTPYLKASVLKEPVKDVLEEGFYGAVLYVPTGGGCNRFDALSEEG